MREAPLPALRPLLSDQEILDACAQGGDRFRKRLYDPVVTLFHFLLKALGREESFAATWQELWSTVAAQGGLSHGTPNSSALAQARCRFPKAALDVLVHKASELVIATAGLSTLEEIARTGTPALLVPTSDRPEEMLNAAYFGARYGMKRLETDRFGPDRLADSAVRLLKRGRSNGEKVGERPGTGIADEEGMERLLELIEGYL